MKQEIAKMLVHSKSIMDIYMRSGARREHDIIAISSAKLMFAYIDHISIPRREDGVMLADVLDQYIGKAREYYRVYEQHKQLIRRYENRLIRSDYNA